MRPRPLLLMTDPSHYAVSYQINPWMRPKTWSADTALNHRSALVAWRRLTETLERAGADIEVVAGAPDLPDMVFPANAAVVLDGKALLAKFRHPERAREEPQFRAIFERLLQAGLLQDVTVSPGVFQEGAGDCLWDGARQLFWVGSGPRSSPGSGRLVADYFGAAVVSLPLATARYYHLDTCFCPLSGGEILVYPPALTTEALARLRARVPADLLIEAETEDAERFCVNAVCLGRTLVMAKPSPRLAARLAERGYSVVGVDLSSFILSGGGAFCMTLRLDLKSRTQPTRHDGADAGRHIAAVNA